MSDNDRISAIECLCEVLTIQRPCPDGSIKVAFWPKLYAAQSVFRERYVEPDIIVYDNAGALLVIEVKWEAPLGEHELAAQWEALSEPDRRRSQHVLLVQETGRYRKAVQADALVLAQHSLSPWVPVVRSWRSLASLKLVATRAGISEPVRLWAAAVSSFVHREHRSSMRGWNAVGLRATAKLEWRFVRPWFAELPMIPRLTGWWTHE